MRKGSTRGGKGASAASPPAPRGRKGSGAAGAAPDVEDATATFSPHREARLLEVARLHAEGRTQAAIATLVKVSQPQVAKDLRVIRARWKAAMVEERQTLVAEKKVQLNAVMREAWEAWQRSKADHQRRTHRQTVVRTTGGGTGQGAGGDATGGGYGGGDRETVTDEDVEIVTGQNPGAEYLRVVLDCIAQERKMCGLDKPVRVQMSGAVGVGFIDFTDSLRRTGPVLPADVVEQRITQAAQGQGGAG